MNALLPLPVPGCMSATFRPLMEQVLERAPHALSVLYDAASEHAGARVRGACNREEMLHLLLARAASEDVRWTFSFDAFERAFDAWQPTRSGPAQTLLARRRARWAGESVESDELFRLSSAAQDHLPEAVHAVYRRPTSKVCAEHVEKARAALRFLHYRRGSRRFARGAAQHASELLTYARLPPRPHRHRQIWWWQYRARRQDALATLLLLLADLLDRDA